MKRMFQASQAVSGRALLAATGLLAFTPGAFGQTVMGAMGKKPPPDFSDRTVTFQATDGVTIEADYYPVKVAEGKRTPVAILIHMYPADRSSWKPLVPKLRDAGIAVLAHDIRGTGGSIKPEERNLKEGYANRDPQHFAAAWMDVEGARGWLSKQDNIDFNRIVLIGASVGCSIALDFVSRQPDAKAVVCISPGTNYMELDSLGQIRNCSNVPILLVAPEGEYSAVEELKAAAAPGQVRAKKMPGGKEHHGTTMFEANYGERVLNGITSYVKKHLGIKNDKKKNDKPDKNDKPKSKQKKPDAA